jgi:hypothetical protein
MKTKAKAAKKPESHKNADGAIASEINPAIPGTITPPTISAIPVISPIALAFR